MITDIHLQNFRSYIDDSFELSPDVNIIVGPNASGKTNLLEALLVISRGSSYRSKDNELINSNSEWSRIEANTNNQNRILKIERILDDKSTKTFNINSKPIKRLNLNQTIPIVLFEPNHLLLLLGSPELRRNYIDDILEQTITGYKTLKGHYKRALSQRNVLLKRNNITNNELFVWNVRLSELGGKLFRERQNLIKKLQTDISDLYDALSSGKEKIELRYKSSINPNNYESDLLKNLEHSIELDSQKGFTSHGPHRDDLLILVNSRLAVDIASRGETRSILLALKILETKVVEQARQQKPILLFDDVFSELDGSRRMALTRSLEGYQSIITTTDADIVIQHFTNTNNIIALTKD